jgi:hypothetical protein
MMEIKRHHWLLIVLGVVLGGYFVNGLVDRNYSQPVEAETRQIALLEKKIRDAKRQLSKLTDKVTVRDELEQRALPANSELASSSYQAWLLNLVTQLDLANPTVDSTTPIDDGDVTRLQFNVKGKGNLRQLTQLLFEFYRAGHLQKISQISLTPSGGERLDLHIAIEALALRRSQNESGLSTLKSDRLVSDQLESYLVIAKRNLFGDGMASPWIRGTRLTAITYDRLGQNQCWFYVESTQQTHFLKVGDSLDLDSVVMRIVEIQTDFVIVELDGTAGRLELGKSLIELQPSTISSPATFSSSIQSHKF